jgi:hypothetical protein
MSHRVEAWGNLFTEPRGLGAEKSIFEIASRPLESFAAKELTRYGIPGLDKLINMRESGIISTDELLSSRGKSLLSDDFVLPGQVEAQIKAEERAFAAETEEKERKREILAQQTTDWSNLTNTSALFDSHSMVDTAIDPEENSIALNDLNEAMREAKDRSSLVEQYNRDMAFDPVNASEQYKNTNVFSPELNWSQKNIAFILAQNAKANQHVSYPQILMPQGQQRPDSGISTPLAFKPQVIGAKAAPQATGFTIRPGSGVSTASTPTKFKGIGNIMQEKEYMDLNSALTAMDKEYQYEQQGPNKAFYESAYSEGSDYIVDDAQVDFYPDETQLKITQITDSAPSTTEIPYQVNSGYSSDDLVDSALAVQDYVVESTEALTPVTGGMMDRFNAMDNTSKIMLVGGAALAAKYLAPSIVQQLPSKLLYLGVAAVIFSQIKPKA